MTNELVRGPQSIWTRPIELRLREFLVALGKFGLNAATLRWEEAGEAAIESAAAIGLGLDEGELAGLLVRRAGMRAIHDILAPHQRDFPGQVWESPPEFERELETTTFELGPDFLAHPRELPVVGLMRDLVERWLAYLPLEGHRAATISAGLPTRFVYMLHRESVERPGDYARLFASLTGVFVQAWQRERSWEEYQTWLESSLDSSVFGEDFGLRQVFIWPRAYYLDAKPKRGDVDRDAGPVTRHVVDLREHFETWLLQNDPRDAIRFLSGDPGAGKSSFARMFAAQRVAIGERVLLIPLHLLDVEAELGSAIESLCADATGFPREPFAGDAPLLLVLDGLDELAKQGRAGEQLAQEFVQQVGLFIERRNLDGRVHARALVTGRPIAVHDGAERREPGQVLHLVGYAEAKHGGGRVWDDPAGLLASDQRHAWWRTYGQLRGMDYEGLPEHLAGEALFEITRQPLLGLLLALVVRDAERRGEALDPNASLNDIYRRLLDGVYERDYATSHTKRHPAAAALERDEFDRLLEEMALAAWHAGGRCVQRSTLEKQCSEAGLGDVLERYRKQRGISQLFSAFYFRRYGARQDEAFEFTHKSFAEYLVARRFVHELAEAHRLLAEHDAAKGRRGRGKDVEGVLVDWLRVFGPSRITDDLMPYLEREVARRAKDEVAAWQKTLIRLIEAVLVEGMPAEKLEGLRFVEMSRWAAAGERGLFELLHCCAWVTREVSNIAWPSPTACREWLLRQEGVLERVWRLAWLGLEEADLWNVDLRNVDLRNVDLRNASLRNASLRNVDFWHADLRYANLRDANLQHANLQHANLRHADLRDTDLQDANLRHADLRDANLRYADLRDADLRDADLQYANLRNADLQGAQILSTTLTPEQRTSIRGTPMILDEDE